MTRILAAALALAVFAVPYSAFASRAHLPHNGAWRAHPPYNGASRAHLPYDGTLPAEAYPNCLPWSPQLHNWVWICGPPYPPDYPHTR